jgi:hypothetical protein
MDFSGLLSGLLAEYAANVECVSCRGDDTMTVSRDRHVIAQPLGDSRKSLANFLIVSR